MLDYDCEKIARLETDSYATVLLSRTGSSLFASGIQARWGTGGTIL